MNKFLIIFLFLYSCEKPVIPATKGNFTNGFFILNEGTFTFGNASLDFYNNDKDSLSSDIYKSINNENLGDVGQSLLRTDKYLLVVVNNSQKIEVLDIKTLKKLKTINGFNAPRYMQLIDSNLILVSELYNKKLHLVNIETATILQSFDVFGWGEKMIRVDQRIILQILKHPLETASKSGFVEFNINDKSIKIKEFIEETNSFQYINNLFFMMNKNVDSSYSLIIKDPNNWNTLTPQINFTKTEYPKFLISDQSNYLYFLNNKKVYRVNIINTYSTFEKEEFIDVSHLQNVYGLQFFENKIIIFDAKNYTQKGSIEIYDKLGKKIKTISSGIIPHEII